MKHLSTDQNLHYNIHQSRRHIKILRSALRLIRYDLGKEVYIRENHFYRDRARALSSGRDLTAMLETVECLEKNCGKDAADILTSLRKEILKERRSARSSHQETIQNMFSLIKDHEVIPTGFEWSPEYQDHLVQALTDTYEKAHKAHLRCCKDTTDENIHEYRKRAKYLRYQFLILKEVWPVIFQATEQELHQQTDYLGQANNLTVLQNHLPGIDADQKTGMEKLRKEIKRKKSHLIENALVLGNKLFAEKPEYFKYRMKEYLAHWSAL